MTQTVFEIREGNDIKTAVEREPTVGKWYCAAYVDFDYDDDESKERIDYGVIAEYVGGGEFYDGDSDETRNMRDADWLIEQN